MSRRASRALLLLAVPAACGPNYRYAYEGESAFERCYALDYESSVTPGDRQACWSHWHQTYAYGANPDRLDYARSRLTASSVGGPPPSATLVPSAPPQGPQRGPAMPIVANTAPSPSPSPTPSVMPPPAAATAPAAPPAPTGLPLVAPSPTTPAESAAVEPPGTSCANECRGSWRTCGGRCAQRDAACEARCDDGYRDCMRGCY